MKSCVVVVKGDGRGQFYSRFSCYRAHVIRYSMGRVNAFSLYRLLALQGFRRRDELIEMVWEQ